MSKIKTCRECGVPLQVSKGQTWRSDGVVVETKDPDHRMVFFESDNMQNVYNYIEDTIGRSIERIVVECQSRSTRQYLEKLISPTVRKILRVVYPGVIAKKMANIAQLYGYGKVEDVALKVQRMPFADRKGDYVVMDMRNPYSTYRFTADIMGGMEAGTGRACTQHWEQTSEDTYRFTITAGAHPPELLERLERKPYVYRGGDIKLDRCPACGVPMEVARYNWNLSEGTITDPDTRRRMAIYGPAALDTTFKELEAELGEGIPDTVIEAQRKYVKGSMRGEDYQNLTASLETALAIRGIGKLAAFEADDKHLSVTIENACLHLWMVGIFQGLFELGTRNDSTKREWDLSPDSVLSIKISA